MATEHILQLEDLARRYDAQVLREYLLDQEGLNGARGALELSRSLRGDSSVAVEDSGEAGQGTLSEVYDLRLRCFGRLRLLLWLNFLAYWSTVAYCGYACYLRTLIYGVKATPPLEAWLLGVFVLGTQGTLEFAASVCLTRPARATEARSSGFQAWDGAAWLVGLGARLSVLLDVQCLALMHRGSAVLFLISLTAFTFAIGLCVVVVQARMLVGLCCSRDHFTYDKPDLFFKGRDAHGMLEGTPIAASAPGVVVDSQGGEPDVGRGAGGGGGGTAEGLRGEHGREVVDDLGGHLQDGSQGGQGQQDREKGRGEIRRKGRRGQAGPTRRSPHAPEAESRRNQPEEKGRAEGQWQGQWQGQGEGQGEGQGRCQERERSQGRQGGRQRRRKLGPVGRQGRWRQGRWCQGRRQGQLGRRRMGR
mmetsp:Transcript_183328/g.581356  ORF Transcript_183328/g.581356 Transcript_183328/m.581356 type:complete len:419 (+) Transcript_183328:60-1316(+)